MGKKTAFIVDDEPDIGELLEFFLSSEFDCTTESNPEAALDHLNSKQYDLVITDYKMNATNGFDILRMAHRTNPKSAKFLMTGAFLSDQELKRACDFPVTLIEKPFHEPSQLLKTIKSVLK